jgi:hypothetical protein
VKTLILSRYSLSACVAIILFAGCGRSLDAPGAVNTVIPGAARMPPANGRMFQAGYSGTLQFCAPRQRWVDYGRWQWHCVVSGSKSGVWNTEVALWGYRGMLLRWRLSFEKFKTSKSSHLHAGQMV